MMFWCSTALIPEQGWAQLRGVTPQQNTQQPQKDSTKKLPIRKDTLHYTTAEVQVEAPRIQVALRILNNPTSYTMNREEIAINGGIQVSDVLERMPSTYIRNYGGLGGLKTVSLQGCTPQQTAVLLNGVRLNNAQNGFFDFSLLPASMMDNISVTNSGGSAVSGSNAIGGTVSFSTLALTEKETMGRGLHPTYRAALRYGSFNELTASGSLSLWLRELSYEPNNTGVVGVARAGTTLQVSAERSSSDGDYSFRFNEFGQDVTKQRLNGDFSNTVFLVNVEDNRYASSATFIGRASRRGAPGAVLQGSVENSQARLNEDDALLILRTTPYNTMYYDASRQRGQSLVMSSSLRYNEQHYRDPQQLIRGANGAEDDYYAREIGINAEYRSSGSVDIITARAEYVYNDLRGDLLLPGSGSLAQRTNLALSLHYDYNTVAYADLPSVTGLSLALRTDYFSDVGTVISPLLKLLQIWKPFTLTASYSYNLRPPSFNEKYYQNYGNINLSPERSHNASIELQYNFFIEYLLRRRWGLHVDTRGVLKLKPFYLSTVNQIIAVPKSALTWSALNAAQVQTLGIEAYAALGLWDDRLRATLSYTYQDVRDKNPQSYTYNKIIPYTPQQLCMIGLQYQSTRDLSRNSILAGVNMQYSSYRYAQADNAIESLLPTYATYNLYMAYTIRRLGGSELGCIITPRIDIQNLLNTQYSIIRNFPMPGFLIRVGLSLASEP